MDTAPTGAGGAIAGVAVGVSAASASGATSGGRSAASAARAATSHAYSQTTSTSARKTAPINSTHPVAMVPRMAAIRQRNASRYWVTSSTCSWVSGGKNAGIVALGFKLRGLSI